LALSGNTLYGTTAVGGSNSNGAIFAIQTDGTGFTNLYNFKGTDGAFPSSGLILSGTILYGTTYMGGSNNNGTVFSITTDGTGFTNLHIFTAGKSLYMNISSNTDGAAPKAGLILSGNTLYGTTTSGGPAGAGTVFAINTSGTAFTNLHSFTASSSGLFSGTNGDGTYPYGRLALSANTLYGTAKNGGSSGFGTVFSLTLPAPQLAITPTSSNIILTWPTNENGFDFTGYTLQCASDLVSGCWTNVSPAPSVVNGQLTVTNPISATQMFYRLNQ
jgi:uncharacterized repeat protein (TIGR03803 family)